MYLESTFSRYMHLEKKDSLYLVLGTVIGHRVAGPPIWTMFVGPPSTGGTAIIETVVGVEGVQESAHFSLGGLLSATSKRDRDDKSTGGLLRRLPETKPGYHDGLLLLRDFTSVVAGDSRNQQLESVLAAMRQIYDGDWARDAGSDGGMHLTWSGKMSLLSKCTPAIDQHGQLLNFMGNRMIYYRFGETNGFNESLKMFRTDPYERKKKLAHAMTEYLANFDKAALKGCQVPVAVEKKLSILARCTSKGRSVIVRDWKTREISDVQEPEGPMRLGGQYRSLYLGMTIAGVDADVALGLMLQVAIDTMPYLRGLVFASLLRNWGKEMSVLELAQEITDFRGKDKNIVTHATPMARTMDELVHTSMVDRVTKGIAKKTTYSLAPWLLKDLEKAGLLPRKRRNRREDED